MRKLAAAAIFGLALAAPGVGAAQDQPGAATERSRTPRPRARRVSTAGVRLGNLTINVPASVEGRGRNARVVINLPQRPPILAGVQERDVITVTVNDQSHTYLAGSGMRLTEVAYACWGS